MTNGEDVHVVGVVQPRDDATATMLSSGLNYPASLTSYVIDQAANSAIVKDQLAHPDTNVFTGKSFDDEEADESGFNMESLFTIDGDAIQAAFTIDQSKLSVDMSNALNLQGSLQNMPAVPSRTWTRSPVRSISICRSTRSAPSCPSLWRVMRVT